ncbi:RNA polymerase sigma factor [Winogradskyella sediminis]|uniref:RNA polymerase sigma-70 factor, ECF subfamily n=1 Tax=Winogradskyella sediminis TaxID=1382466 RepID=A0A1H1V4Q7_9FLAO|nr:RNA polymerase sigma factor [Winogradskyella sediminis]REG87619.1 RNA polymerase sigma-70 factor (ECF subfamily) [Winogradskyella sediminis]SDS79693.1 RNA polymerase sigma-70 factor, ECF subfamily [Winogradskyella sediminis]
MQKLETKLITLCKKGNEVAQMQVYDKYSQAMYTIACHYLSDEDAKDAMQEGFLKAFGHIESYKPEATFGAWLKRIIINQCLDVLKKNKLEFEAVEVSDLQITIENDWQFDTSITKQEILFAVEQISEKHRIVVKLYLLEGYDHEEISDILGIPIKTSRTHLRRGKLQLQELLKQKYNEARY